MSTPHKPTPERCAEWIKDHQYTQLAKTKSLEVWRCQTPGTHSYAFDLTMSRYGMAMYGDTGSLVFDVGISYGLPFLAGDDEDYVFRKLDASSREMDLDTAYVLDIVYNAIIDLLSERDLQLPEWLPHTEPMPARVQELENWLMASDFKDGEYSALVVALRACQNLENPTTSGAYEWLSEHQELLELGDDMDYSLGKPTNSVMNRIYMLRHAAKQILARKAAAENETETEPSPAQQLTDIVDQLERYGYVRPQVFPLLNAATNLNDDLWNDRLLTNALETVERAVAPLRDKLYAVHAQGPDELYAATSLEAAQKHAHDLNLIQAGIARAVVVDSPWSPVEHWKTLAEQNQHQVDDLRGQWVASAKQHSHELATAHSELMHARGFILARHAFENDETAIEAVAGIDKVLASERQAELMAKAEGVEYAYGPALYSEDWSNDDLATYVSDRELVAGTVIYRGKTSKQTASHYVPDADDVIQHMFERASDDSEYADSFPDLTKEQIEEVDLLLEPLRVYMDRHCDVKFYEVQNIEPYTVTDEDVAAALAYRTPQQAGEPA